LPIFARILTVTREEAATLRGQLEATQQQSAALLAKLDGAAVKTVTKEKVKKEI